MFTWMKFCATQITYWCSTFFTACIKAITVSNSMSVTASFDTPYI